MNRTTFLQTVFILFFVSPFSFLYAQKSEEIFVKTLKEAYEWNEKATVEYSGLPTRDAYSNRYDDIVLVPAGTPDSEYGEGQRVYVSKPSGQVEFAIPKPGKYEVRVYLYEKPGLVSARSSIFKMLSAEEGNLENKSNGTLMEIAMRNRGNNKELMCRATSEYFRRKPMANDPNYRGMKALQSMCPSPTVKTITTAKTTIYPIKARYQCYRILSNGNEVAEDIFILSNTQYKTMNKVGNYSYNPKTRILTFRSGPLFFSTEKWVGVYTGKGEPTGNGGTTVEAIIEIRKQADVEEGNRKVLQQCSCAQ